MDRICNERIRVITKVGAIAKKVQESSLKVVWASSEKRRILCGQNNDGDGGVVVNGKRLIRNIDPTYNVKECVKGRQFLLS